MVRSFGHNGFDLLAAAREDMIEEGFEPELPAEAVSEAEALRATPQASAGARDLRDLPWSSIDNDSSRDLDQIEVADRINGGIRVRVAIADVDAAVAIGSAIDRYAANETTTVYTGVRTFPMLPERLSTDLTSLGEGADRPAVVIEYTVGEDGSLTSSDIYAAEVRNRARLTYSGVGAWLEGRGAVPAGLEEQLKLQADAASLLREQRHRLGALSFDRVEARAVLRDGAVHGITAERKNAASDLIEDFMIAANEVMARRLGQAGVSSIRRVVKAPERWPRIIELAARYDYALPVNPDAGALNAFLAKRKAVDAVHFPDLSLAVMKLMGSGEYSLVRPGDNSPGHFGLAAQDYTHSTAPNRRFADLITQRLVRAVLAGAAPPYSDDALDDIARNCTLKEDAARKVERKMNKRIAAVALAGRVGETFSAVVTGVKPKGVFVRVLDPPVEGRLMRGEHGLDVGDRVRVTLLATDPERGFIDFAR